MFRLLAPILAAGFSLAMPAASLAAAVTGPGEDTPLNLPADTPRTVAGTGGSGNLVRTIVGLAVVIGVIYGVAWVLRQVKDSRETRVSGVGLQHAATIPLGPNRSLHLVRAGRELVLVGERRARRHPDPHVLRRGGDRPRAHRPGRRGR